MKLNANIIGRLGHVRQITPASANSLFDCNRIKYGKDHHGPQICRDRFHAAVKKAQERNGSRRSYARLEEGGTHHDSLGSREMAFIADRDSFYMATVGETGWPYIQHRGGPSGFVRIIDEKTIRFADFAGNRQYVSVGNLQTDDRVSLFFMDYPNQTRLKLLGRVRLIEVNEAVLLERLRVPGYGARTERGMVITV